MNKKSKITSLAAATLATVVLAGANLTNEVKADTQPAGTSSKSSSAVDNAEANVKSAQTKVDTAQQNVNTAQATLDSAKAAAQQPDSNYSAQEGVVSSAQEDVNNKTQAVTNADAAQKKAQNLVDEAKQPGAIDKAKQAVTNKQDDIRAQQEKIDSLKKNDLKKANDAVTDAQTNLGKKNTALTNAKKDKDKADTAVQTAEDALKGTGITEAKKDLDDANEKLNSDNSKLTEAKNNVTAQETKVETDKANLKNAKEVRDNYNTQNKNIIIDYNNKKAKSDQAKSNLDHENGIKKTTEDQLASLKDLSRNTITIPDVEAYKKAYADYFMNGKLSDDDIAYVKEAIKANSYVSSKTDAKQDVDLNNLTDSQIKEISLFTADLITKVRSQLGFNSPMNVTKGSITFAKKVAEGYNNDLKSGKWKPDWHDDDAIDAASKSLGLDDNGESGEAMYGFNVIGNHINMDELKGYLYDNLLTMIIPTGNGVVTKGGKEDYEFGHASVLLSVISNISYGGKMMNRHFDDDAADNIGVTLTNDTPDPEYGTYYSSMRTHFLPSYSYSKNSAYDNTIIPSYSNQIKETNKSLKYIKSKLSDLQQKYDDAEQLTSDAKIKADKVLQKQNENQAAVDKAQSELDSANKELDKRNQAKDKAVKQYNKSLAVQKDTQDKYNKLTASNEEKTKNLEAAQKKRADAKTALDKAQTNVTNAKTALNTAKQAQDDLTKNIKAKQDAVKGAQNELDKLTQHVTDLQNAPESLQKAKDALIDAKAKLKTAQDTLSTEQAKLDSLKGAKNSADSSVVSAQAAYDQAQNEFQAAQASLNTAQNNLKSIQAQEAVMANAKASSTTKKNDSNDAKSLNLNHDAYAYDKHGKAIMKNGKHVTYKKGTAISAVDNGRLVNIKGEKYYQIGDNEFIKAANVSTSKTAKKSTVKTVKLTHTAFVYNKNGKAVRKGLKIKSIKRGKTVKALKTVTIKGKKYYQIGKNEYIKVANTKLKAKTVKLTATVKGKKNVKVATYNRSGKKNKHYVYGKKSYKFNEKITVKGKVYYKIAGKNDWVPAKKLNLKK